MKKATCLLSLSLLLALPLACGGSKTPAPGTAAQAEPGAKPVSLADPAALLTKADAEAVLGAPAGAPETRDNPMGQKIVFYSPAESGKSVRFVQLSLVQTGAMPDKMRANGQSAPKLFADTAQLLGNTKEMPGLGDKAFWGGRGLKAGAGLHVLKGETYFTVGVAMGDEQADLQAAEKLARQILTRL